MKKWISILCLLGLCAASFHAYALTSHALGDNHIDRSAASVDMTGLSSSEAFVGMADYNKLSIQVSWTGAVATTPVFKLESTVDGTNWDDIQDSSGATVDYTVSANSGTHTFHLSGYTMNQVRVTVSTTGTGTLTPRVLASGRK